MELIKNGILMVKLENNPIIFLPPVDVMSNTSPADERPRTAGLGGAPCSGSGRLIVSY